jgi:hypothetical protein
VPDFLFREALEDFLNSAYHHYGASTHLEELPIPLRSHLPRQIEHFAGRFNIVG